MSISLDPAAPGWAHRFRQAIENAIEVVWSRPMATYTVSTLPNPVDRKWVGRQVRVTDGTSGKPTVVCNGANWLYQDGNVAA